MEKCAYKRVMLKVSGEALSGENGFGFDFDIVNDGTLDDLQVKCIELVQQIEKETRFERHVVKRPVVKEIYVKGKIFNISFTRKVEQTQNGRNVKHIYYWAENTKNEHFALFCFS